MREGRRRLVEEERPDEEKREEDVIQIGAREKLQGISSSAPSHLIDLELMCLVDAELM